MDTTRNATRTARHAVNARLSAIAQYAKQAQRTPLDAENMTELLDLIDTELQEVIALVRNTRDNAASQSGT